MLDPLAAELNGIINDVNPNVFQMLSRRGKAIFFPERGILAQTAEAKGKAINATIGVALEDCGSPMELPTLSSQIARHEDGVFAYAPNLGSPKLRQAWKNQVIKKNDTLTQVEEISTPVVTAALTHGLSAAGSLFLDEGDALITPDLFWENYDLVFNYAYGSHFDTFAMFNGPEGKFNLDGLREKLMGGAVGKKVVILNFPNNPTGYTVTIDEANAIRDIIVEAANAGNNVVALIDDAYFGLVYEDGILDESMFAKLANAHEKVLAVKIDGPTKEDYVWGMRIGFVTFGCKRANAKFYKALEAKLGGCIRGSTSSASNIGQIMLLNAYAAPSYESEKIEKFNTLKYRYQKIKSILESRKEYGDYLRALPFNSGYFMCLEIKNGKAEEVRKLLLEKYDTGTIALGSLLRVAFSSTPYSLIEKLFDNIYQAAREVS